ncbi:4Fe-4S dicluster domain-containing protein [Desulfosporosinus sp. OT]|uniref:4Fe-4S dicluster domain-containing protein n=1 Tax=Desulfosporosinus sp. OT TaxID=913865 RepID=UPI000223AA73|nr:4Fe-4S dicluster domain-containing protein [Desulfosporosinus sp. OT]EGW39730.1 4Fe-4S binding domain protein [Desulfosporosinus sp. OT]
MISQKVFLVNPNRCLGCKTCQIACAVQHGLPPGVFLRKVELVELSSPSQIIKYYISTSCHHCANPECFRLCSEGAYRKLRNGIVVFDQAKCTGCGTCIRSCSFGAPIINPLNGKVIKCDMCYGNIEDHESPYCVAACPVEALKVIDAEHINRMDLDLKRTLPGLPRIELTQPSVRYVAVVMGKQIFRRRVPREGGRE